MTFRLLLGHLCSVCCLLFLWPAWATAQTHTGKVIRVLDGDTLDILEQGRPLRVRLAYIDAPEKGQPFSERSRQTLAELCAGQLASVRSVDTDRYGRTVGDVQCQGRSANWQLVHEGMAWVYRKYTPSRHPYYEEERSAQAMHRGLWADPAPEPPWEWRRARRTRSSSTG
ncbi:MAG TPA: thermonuclease family protein [Macromonas sp.]|nr:thermonuclease family protein [Macromonas sp.]